MSASSSSDNANSVRRVPDEECFFKGKYEDYSTTVKISVDCIKERFKEEGRIELESHKFKIKDETFTIEISFFNEAKNAEECSIGVYLSLSKEESRGSPKSIVSFKCEFLGIDRPELEYKKRTFKKRGQSIWGWPEVLNKTEIEVLPNNTLNLFCTVTLHIKEKDSRITMKSRSVANLVEEKIASYNKRKVGIPTAQEKLFTDFVIESGDGMVIKCHRNFLASHSSVFRAMLINDMTEANERRLKLDFCGEVLQHFVDFLYDTTLDKEVVLKHYEDFLNLAEMFDIDHLKLQIEDVLIKNLSTDVMTSYYVLGDLYNAQILKEAARVFLVNNRDCFKDKEFIKQLQKLNPERIVEIIGIVM